MPPRYLIYNNLCCTCIAFFRWEHNGLVLIAMDMLCPYSCSCKRKCALHFHVHPGRGGGGVILQFSRKDYQYFVTAFKMITNSLNKAIQVYFVDSFI